MTSTAQAPPIEISGAGIRVRDVAAVAREGVQVTLAADARERLVTARAIVDRVAASRDAVYGLTTALGANTGAVIPDSDIAAYQARAVRARAVGVGPPLPTDVVRAMLFARACGMAVGGSGVSPAVVDALLALLNDRVHPIVPSIGSIGAADLAPLSHLALPLLGEGRAEVGGVVLDGATALARAGLSSLVLSGKDGLALISSNAATVGRAALVLVDALRAVERLELAAALTFEGFRANLSPLDPRVHAARGAPGQILAADRLRALLEGSSLHAPGSARRVQDPIALRCVAQVHGVVLRALEDAQGIVERELNGATDSPLVVAADGAMLSNGNFDTSELALAFETLGLAIAHAGTMCLQRCQRMYSPATSGLPLQLTRLGPAHSGFGTLQKTLTALCAQLRQCARPALLDSVPVSEAIEDHASMAPQVVSKTAAMLPWLDRLVAIELVSAAQAIELRGLAPAALGHGTRIAFALVRGAVPVLEEDRPLGPDVEALVTTFTRPDWRMLP